MYWTKLSGLFFFSIIKFLLTPLGGPKLGLTFLETYLSCVAGGIFGAIIFYFSANYFMHRAVQKRSDYHKKCLTEGIEIVEKKKFTRTNKFIVRLKRKLGIFGTAMWVPLFLSVPLGSIITAKFYGHDKRTFPIIVLGMFVNGFVMTSIAYLFMG
jgi:hypothetical protein